MPRSRAHSGSFAPLLAALFLGIVAVAPRPALAAEPEVEPFLDAARDLGLECDESSGGGWSCHEFDDEDSRDVSVSVSDVGSSFYVSAFRLRYDSGVVPAESDVYTMLRRIVTTALGDSETALDWLAEMNADPEPSGEFNQGNWSLNWSTWAVEGATTPTTELELDLHYFDGGAPAAGSAGPEVGPLLDIAREITTKCDEYEPGLWLCSFQDDERSIGVNVSDYGTSFQVNVGRNRFAVAEPASAEADVYAAMRDVLGLILPDDTEAEAWLADMNAGPQSQGNFVSGDWSLSWSAEMIDLVDGVANITFDAFYFPTGGPIEPSAAPAPSFAAPSFGPGELAASSLGEWTYQGDWTLVAFEGGNRQEPDPPLGTTVPATLTIRCTAESVCTASSTDGVGFTELPFDLAAAGRLTSTRTFDRDDCGAVETHRIEIEHGADRAVVTSSDTTEPLSCSSGTRNVYFFDYTWAFDGVLTEFLPAEGDASGQSPAPAAAAPVTPQDSSASAGGLEFARSVPTVADVSTDPIVVLQSAALAALLVFLMPFPSQLFNSTLETHEDEVRRWLRLDRIGSVVGGIGAFWASWPGVALFTLLAALLYGFLDPGFGLNLGSLATFVGMLVGILLVTAAFAIPAVLAHRRHADRPSLKVVPVSLLIGVACVLLSRLTDFQPGYLYGLLIGLAFARELSAAEEGRATAVGAGLMLAVAFASWLGLGALPDGDGFALVVVRTALAALMVAGLEGVVFGLLPMRFLPGEPLYRWNRVLWGGLLLIGAFSFFHILINPASGYLSDTSRTPLLTVVALLVGFSLVSVAFWAWFRFGSDRPSAPEPTH